MTTYGCVNYPEIFAGEYDRYALWLTSRGVVDPHIRDQFSAGGRVEMRMADGSKAIFPAVYRRIVDNYELFIQRMCQYDPAAWGQVPGINKEELNQRLMRWIKSVSNAVKKTGRASYDESVEALKVLFWGPDAN